MNVLFSARVSCPALEVAEDHALVMIDEADEWHSKRNRRLPAKDLAQR